MEQQNLAQALVKAQAEIGKAPKNGENPHFRSSFATLEDLIDVSRPALLKYGIAVTQFPDSDGENNFLVTKMKHVSGQEEVSRIKIMLKDPTNVQSIGSAITYLKRYAYAAMCGIATSDDDDGHSASDNGSHGNGNGHSSSNGYESKPGAISPKQLGLLLAKMRENENGQDRAQHILEKFKVGSLKDLSWKNMEEALQIMTS